MTSWDFMTTNYISHKDLYSQGFFFFILSIPCITVQLPQFQPTNAHPRHFTHNNIFKDITLLHVADLNLSIIKEYINFIKQLLPDYIVPVILVRF